MLNYYVIFSGFVRRWISMCAVLQHVSSGSGCICKLFQLSRVSASAGVSFHYPTYLHHSASETCLNFLFTLKIHCIKAHGAAELFLVPGNWADKAKTTSTGNLDSKKIDFLRNLHQSSWRSSLIGKQRAQTTNASNFSYLVYRMDFGVIHGLLERLLCSPSLLSLYFISLGE